MKVLVAIDASETAKAMIEEVAARCWADGDVFCLLYVVKSGALASDFVDVESYVDVETLAARDWLREAAQRLQKAGLAVSAVVLKGRPAKVIVDYARQWQADWLLLGASQQKGLAAFFPGSVAKEVLRHVSCNVEVIRSRAVRHSEAESALPVAS